MRAPSLFHTPGRCYISHFTDAVTFLIIWSPHVTTQYTQHTVSCWWFKLCSIRIHSHSMCLIYLFFLGYVLFRKHLTSPVRSAVSHPMSVHRGLSMRECSTSNGWGRWKRSLRIRSTLPSLVGRMMMNQWILGFWLKDYIMCYHVTAHLAKERCARWFLTGNCQTFGPMSTFRCLCVSVLVTSRRYMLIYGRPLISDLCLIRCQQRPFAPLLWSQSAKWCQKQVSQSSNVCKRCRCNIL